MITPISKIIAKALSGYAFYCPGCDCIHIIATTDYNPTNTNVTWSFNNDFEKPTFNPSILVRATWPDGERVCHSFIRNGQIQYLTDCTHEFAGKTIDLPTIPDEWISYS